MQLRIRLNSGDMQPKDVKVTIRGRGELLLSIERGRELSTMHHHRGCCPATLSPLVAIHHIGVILEGICLHHTAVQEPVNVSPQEVPSCSAIRLCLRSKHICIISRACSRATAASSHICFETFRISCVRRSSGMWRCSSVCKGVSPLGKNLS